ncbi:MAG: sensor histidine kinase [Mitsuaria chitosanitabida]|uniref:sensor histidine kinase n=1 Tax=Roseateles chitosanitabidus TaxID=65048 RepID=UPI001B12860C|nr:ATP-binding protein [Roseateles chitosanitabidus]MBO9687219.1 sensor histidine kinase [Roseateles chitosanitabidus]
MRLRLLEDRLNPIRALLRPTLMRRLLGVLMAAFALVGLVLVTLNYLDFKAEVVRKPAVLVLAREMALVLAQLPEAEAPTLSRVFAERLEHLRGESGMRLEPVEWQVRRIPAAQADTGAVVFATSRIGVAIPMPGREPGTLDIGGQPYWFGQSEAGPWRVVIAERCLDDSIVVEAIWKELAGSLLLAFPLVVLPVWIAVRRGMRPLTQLAREVEGRDAQDLAPLGFTPRHDELVPLVGAFDGLLARLRQQLQRERSFVHDAAHELRTPMAVVAVQAHLLAQARGDEDRRAAAEALHRALERAAHLSRQLLVLAAVDDSRGAVAEPVDLAELAQARLAQSGPDAARRRIDMALDAPAAMPLIADRMALESILGNLIENALRYVPPGGQVSVTISIGSGASRGTPDSGGDRSDPGDRGDPGDRRGGDLRGLGHRQDHVAGGDGDQVVLVVADDGPGIAPDRREQAFERFWRGQQAGEISGTGLGLAIVREAARRLGGEALLEDGLPRADGGVGLAVVVRWPRVTPAG